MSARPHWYAYRTQHSHYTSQGLPFARCYEDWEPVHLERLARGIRVLPREDWAIVSWKLDEDETWMNREMGGYRIGYPVSEDAAA